MPEQLVITRTWTATDVCGNTANAVQTITVDDQIDPVISGTPADITFDCAGDVPVANANAVTATDNCPGAVTLAVADATAPGSCPNSFVITRTWTATDLCGNTATAVQTITVDDQVDPVISGTPADISFDCAGDVPVANANAVTATDNCPGAVTLAVADATAPGSCPNSFVITRTWTATDLCGNTATAVQTITVDDQVDPVISGTPADISFDCAGDVPVANANAVTATDNCPGAVTLAVADATAPGSCPNSFVITRTWTATDLCGNTATAVQTITVDDQVDPVISGTPADISFDCAGDVPVANANAVTATDNCPGAVTLAVADATAPGSCPNSFVITRTWTATDLCGNTATAVQTITVDDQVDPVISGTPADISFDCAGDVPVANANAVTATDNCPGAVTLAVADATAPGSCPNSFVITRTWTATDLCGNTATAVQTITVDDQVDPVISGTPADISFDCAGDVPVANANAVTATDNCPGAVTLAVADATAPGSCPNSFVITRTWTATDLCGNTATAVQTITVDDQVDPVISGTPADISFDCAGDVPVANANAVTATDNCPGAVTLAVADATAPGSCPNSFVITRTWTATDLCGNTATAVQTITVDDQVDPVISGTPADISFDCAGDVPVANANAVTATDNCPGAVTLAVADATAPGSCPNSFVITRTWTATDLCGNTATAVQTITVDDQVDPVISGTPADITFDCAGDVPVANANAVTATDNCPGAVALTVADATAPGSCPNSFVITRTWTATDLCGNTATAVQTITVDDQVDPVISGTPADITFDCAGDVPVANANAVTATDNCPGAVALTVADATAPGSCPNSFVITRTWTATDLCGNTATAVQTITVDDQVDPVISGTPADITFACAGDVPVANANAVTATDNCPGVVALTVADATAPGSCPNSFVITRTWTATDLCGNTATAVQTITVDDQVDPVISGTPADITFACAGDVPVANANAVTATDNCPGL